MKDNRLRIGFDIDGVLVDFVQGYRIICEETLQRSFPHAPTGWNFPNWDLTTEEYEQVKARVCGTNNFFMHVPVHDDVSRHDMVGLRKHLLFFITSRWITTGMPVELQTAYWLSSKFGIGFPTVIVADEKGSVARALKLDAFIDDKPENLDDIQKYSSRTHTFLLRRPWNEAQAHLYNSVNSVLAFAEVLDTYTKGVAA